MKCKITDENNNLAAFKLPHSVYCDQSKLTNNGYFTKEKPQKYTVC